MNLDLNNPHDSFFKKVMSNVANVKDFLQSFLPDDVSNKIDFNTLKIIDTEKSNRQYKKYYLDLSVECKLSGNNTSIYIIFEHKSYADKFALIQILNYCTVIWENCIKNNEPLIPIIPVIFYHGEERYNFPTRFIDYFQGIDDVLKRYLVDFNIELFDAQSYKDEDLIKFSKNIYLVASLLGMKYIFSDIEKVKPIFQKIIKISKDQEIFLTVFEYFLTSQDIKEEEVEKLLKEVGGDKMPSFAQRWLEQGIQKGLQQGLLQDAREMVLDAYKMKFGKLDVNFKDQILQIEDRKKLKRLFRLILKSSNEKDFKKKF